MDNFLLDEQLLAFSEGLCSVKLVNWLVDRLVAWLVVWSVSSFVVPIPDTVNSFSLPDRKRSNVLKIYNWKNYKEE
jgi:hypothetical protein